MVPRSLQEPLSEPGCRCNWISVQLACVSYRKFLGFAGCDNNQFLVFRNSYLLLESVLGYGIVDVTSAG